MRYYHIFLVFLLVCLKGQTQILSTLHSKQITLNSDTVVIDSLSVVPETIHLFDISGKIIPDKTYRIDYSHSILILKNSELKNNEITIVYRTFPIDLKDKFYHKNTSIILQSVEDINNSNAYTVKENKLGYNSFAGDELIKRGSISRGVSFGNNQDVVVNSSLNLQLSGKLGKDLNILAAVTDNNIPIQPEGNTQQIQDFDKVFITIFNETFKLTVGDFELLKPTGSYMLMNRKVQGLLASNVFSLGKKKALAYKSTVSGSVSKGKYFRMNITGIEGTQGPYRLKGALNEPFIIIIAGSERVYIDGKLMERGQNFDYVIDYNTAELTFTSKQPITKDKRILVEYEYSDKNYARFMLFSGNDWTWKKGKIWLNYFLEQDSKNQSLQQTLTDSEKRILSEAGDSSELAVVPFYSLDTTFSSNQIYYKMADTIVNSTLYDSIFIYSIDPLEAIYRVGFTYLGPGKGNYIQEKNAANGRVFTWIAPVNNIPQGDYEPIRQLIAPRKKNVVTTGADFLLFPTLRFKYEFGLSGNDLNTFSTKDDSNNSGYAFKSEIERKFNIGDTTKNKSSVAIYFQQVDKKFDPVERFRSAEFERDWNLSNSNTKQNEMMAGINANFNRIKTVNIGYGFDYMNRENNFTGIKHTVDAKTNWKGFQLLGNASYLNSDESIKKTEYLRHKVSIKKSLNNMYAGISEEQEINTWKKTGNDSLFSNSFRFDQWEIYTGIEDTSKNPLKLSYRNRKDFLPAQTALQHATQSQDFTLSTALMKNPKNRIKADITYRILDIMDTTLTNSAKEDNLTGRIEHSCKLFKSLLLINTIYETGSGLEVKKDFVYLEVPAGQGVYTWTDYNSNGIKELNEFDVAMFQDQATYIRVFTPTNEYVKVYNNNLTQVINLKPDAVWGNKKGLRKLISRFSDQLAYNVDNKHSSTVLADRLNPFPGTIPDSMTITNNMNFRNTLSFNRTNSVFGIDYQYQNNRGSLLLLNGTDTRNLETHSLKFRWNISRSVSVLANGSKGRKAFNSEYFSSRNYNIELQSIETSVSFQPSVSLRFTGNGKYNEKINISGSEKANIASGGLEIRYNILKKGDLSFKMDYINIAYSGISSSAVGYELLEGLLPGNNGVWNIQYQRDLSTTLQINVSYNGRITQDTKAVHIGTVQMRAFF